MTSPCLYETNSINNIMEIHPPNSLNTSTTTKCKKEKNKRCHQLLIQIIYDFAENTTLNGIKYMAEKKASALERLFWIATVTLSAVLCIFMVHKSYIKWETGVIISLKEHLVYANEMPFPAVTICPQAKIRQSIYNFTDKFAADEYIDEPPSTEFHSLMVFCDYYYNETAAQRNFLENVHTDIKKFFEVAPKHEDVFEDCVWREKHNCKDAFRPVLTSDGVCYTFNSLATDEIFRKNSVHQRHYYLNTTNRRNGWSLENNYHNSNQDTYPRRGRGNGAKADLFITLKEVTDRDFRCEQHTRLGYKVYLHHPADLPQASLHYYAALPERTTSFALTLNILDTSKEVTDYEPNVRQCYYPSERKLQFFKKYTSKNCQLECLANYTLHRCECVSYYMPRNTSMRICKANNDHQCIEQALDEYAVQEGSSESQTSQCRCLPSCFEINYDADIIITKFDQKEYEKRSSALEDEVFNEYDEEYDEEHEEEDEEGGKDDETHSNDLNKSVTRPSSNGDKNIADNAATQNDNDYQTDDNDSGSSDVEYYDENVDQTNNSRPGSNGDINVADNVATQNDNDYETDGNDSGSSNDENYDENVDQTNTSRLSEIRIYYKRPRFVAMERSEMFGLSQFLADCGGTLGLFLGFSFLTLAEIFYFFTLKLCCLRDATGEKKENCNCMNTA